LNKWAVLVAGSKNFYNYRHQADVCHAYHLLKRQGIPESNIIVMAYDDVAYHKENPFPGTLYNGKDGINYYEGCKIDYTGKDVNKHNFMQVLKG
jgi:legumain